MKNDKVQKMNQIKSKILKSFSGFIRWFIAITTGVLIICAVDFTIFHEGNIPEMTLWDILLSSFVTTVVTIVFWGIKEVKEGACEIAAIAMHYICLCIVMIVFGAKFGWMELNLSGILMMVLSVAAVYIFSFIVNYILDSQQADMMNQKLKEKYSK